MKTLIKNQEGIVLVVTLLILLVLTLIGISAVGTTVYEASISGNDRVAADAFYTSEAGAQVGINQLPTISAISQTQLGQGSGQSFYWSGGPQDKPNGAPLKSLGKYPMIGFDATFEFKRYQVNATGASFSAMKEVEVQVSMGPYGAGTQYNN